MHFNIKTLFDSLNLQNSLRTASTGERWLEGSTGKKIVVNSPVDGKLIGEILLADQNVYNQVLETAEKAFTEWRKVPAPHRGEVVRKIGQALRENKESLGTLVSYEMGKSLVEGIGEVQEMIDICDYAVGLSRTIGGKTIPSERTKHRIMEQYHSLGIVGIISAFNFPVAVWSWNSALAWVCGDVCVWKPSEKTPFSAIACQMLIAKVFKENGVPEGVSNLVLGDHAIGASIAKDTRIPLVSATGSVRMGKSVSVSVAERLGKSLLELGGNNALIISKKADLPRLLIGVVFGSIGTAGQRCTTTRRLLIQEDLYEEVCEKLIIAYSKLKIGNPLLSENHMGPLIDHLAVKSFQKAILQAQSEGGKVLVPGKVLSGPGYESGCYVSPCIIEMPSQTSIVREETFAPILYILKFKELSEAIQIQNGVNQGLSSALLTDSLLEAELYLSSEGSDCGIANVNIGTSGAEIGGAFGGEKETGGGRESGSDSWKIYMRRQTNTINYGDSLPLAQGIHFDLN